MLHDDVLIQAAIEASGETDLHKQSLFVWTETRSVDTAR